MQKGFTPKLIPRSRFNPRVFLMVVIFAIFGGYLFIHFSNASTQTGDINGDNTVNITDLSLLLSSYDQNTTHCITNGAYTCDLSSPSDGIVDVFDLSILLSNYGKTVSQLQAGHINFMEKTAPETDTYTNNPTATTQQWMRDHWTRALVFSTYWDTKLSWYPNGWAYADSYAIYNPSALATQHPEWILKDASGNKLYIPFGCSSGSCPQFAADIGSPAWRQYYIDNAKSLISKGYKGIFVDDVNMDMDVGDGNGTQVAPIDPRTGAAMTDTAWKSYFADFMEQLRTAIPNAEIVHNAIWFAGGGTHDATDSYIIREIKAADYINTERGFNDSGLTGGTYIWSVYALMHYIDNVHTYGSNVILQSYVSDIPSMEYNLSGYFLVNNGSDYISTTGGSLPDSWWSAYDINLGNALGARYQWNGLWRRDFSNGFVLLNEPGASTKSVGLGSTFKNTSGQLVSNVSLGAASGAVLLKQ